jgi:predicted nuclease of predicted toxin-antitoxin system
MLRLLLDEHLQARLVAELHRHNPLIDVVSLHEWEQGAYLATNDAHILAEAYRQHRTLVTRDARTIAPLLKHWGEQGMAHGGVIFLDHRSLPEGNIGALVTALLNLHAHHGQDDWTDAVIFLHG